MAIKCCEHCVPPKRYPGCGAKCPEYIEEKAADAEKKKKEYQRKKIDGGICYQRTKSVVKAMRRHGRKI